MRINRRAIAHRRLLGLSGFIAPRAARGKPSRSDRASARLRRSKDRASSRAPHADSWAAKIGTMSDDNWETTPCSWEPNGRTFDMTPSGSKPRAGAVAAARPHYDTPWSKGEIPAGHAQRQRLSGQGDGPSVRSAETSARIAEAMTRPSIRTRHEVHSFSR